jgi:hypothetical protein
MFLGNHEGVLQAWVSRKLFQSYVAHSGFCSCVWGGGIQGRIPVPAGFRRNPAATSLIFCLFYGPGPYFRCGPESFPVLFDRNPAYVHRSWYPPYQRSKKQNFNQNHENPNASPLAPRRNWAPTVPWWRLHLLQRDNNNKMLKSAH